MPIINVKDVIVRKRHRKVDNDKVKQLAMSIDQAGLINPIIISGHNVLIAGAHRLAAFKLLDRDTITYGVMGHVDYPTIGELVEIDENLFRNELSESEKSEHLSRRIELIAERKMPEAKKSIIKTKIDRREIARNSSQYGNKNGQKDTEKEIKIELSAKRAAIAEAKKEVAAMLGTTTGKISEAISNHNAIEKVGLDKNKLEELNGVQYKRVASVAKKQGKEAAEKELELFLTSSKGDSKPVTKQAIDFVQLAKCNLVKAKQLNKDDGISNSYKSAIAEIEKIIYELS